MAFIALLDANVLWPAALRCTLVRAAIKGLYRAAFTEQILDEMRRSILRERPDVKAQRIDRTVRLLKENVPHLLVEDYEPLIPVMTNDGKDRHVLAAAVVAGAGTIVTRNKRHFPAASRKPYGIELHSPDEFLMDLWGLSSTTVVEVIVEQAAALKNPPRSPREVAEGLDPIAPKFVDALLASGRLPH